MRAFLSMSIPARWPMPGILPRTKRLATNARLMAPQPSCAAGDAHDGCGAISLALVASRFVLGRIPGIGHLAGIDIERNARIVALGRSDHPVTPVLRHHGHPLPGNIDRSSGLGVSRTST